jgi:hypothetical protein
MRLIYAGIITQEHGVFVLSRVTSDDTDPQRHMQKNLAHSAKWRRADPVTALVFMKMGN